MANIRYRGSTVPTDVNAAGGKNAALTNTEIDQNFFALDRDKLDKGTAYSSTVQTVAGPVTFSNNITITGNLTVGGTTTTVNSTVVSIADINIELARTATTAAQANGAGLTVTGPTTAATLTYTSADDRWNFNKNLNVGTVHGALSGNASTASTLQTARTINGVSFDGSANISFTTNAVGEGTNNLYYTDARARGALSFVAGSGAYNSSTGVITIPTNTSQLTNGANFITLGSISATAPVSYSNGVISMPAATATANGYMTSTYASKLDGIAANATNVTNTNQLTNGAAFITLGSISATAPVSYNNTNGVISISAATQSAAGSMSAADKTKLDGIAVNATNVTNTNQLTNGANFITLGSISATAPVSYSNGVISISAATQTAAGSMSAADKTKLDGIATGATNVTPGNGTLSVGAGIAGATNTSVSISMGAYSANTTSNATISYTVGPALINLAAFMTNTPAGFIKRTGQDTYAIDTNTYSTTDTNTTYSIKASTQTGGAGLDLDAGGSGSGTDTVKILGSTGTTVTRTDADTITISSTSVGDGTLTTAAVTAGVTNTTVALNLSGAYSANTTNNRTINPVVGPAITNLATLMTSGNTGFIKRIGQDTYSIDTNTYLTSYTETSTLAQVLGRGNTIGPVPATYFINWAAPSGPFSAGTNLQSEVLRFTNTGPSTSGISSEYKSINCIDSTGPIASIRIGNGSDRLGRIEFGNMAYWTGATQSYGNGTYPIVMRAASSNGTSAILEVTSGEIRSPIFYEYNNTSYYLDLASTGTALNVRGGIVSGLAITGGGSLLLNGATGSLEAIPSTGSTAAEIRSGASNGIIFKANNSSVAQISSSGIISSSDITAYGSPSDRKLKENIKPLVNSLEKVMALEGVSFNWKKDTKEHTMVGLNKDIGLIAQNVQEVVPELVREGEDGTLSLRDRGLVAILIEAIKELNAKVEDLQKQLSNK